MDNALILIISLLLNGLFAGPRSLIDRLGINRLLQKPAGFLRTMERKLNRDHRSPKEREIRGMVVVAGMFVTALMTGLIGSALFHHTSRFFEIFLLAVVLPTRPSWDIAMGVRMALEKDNLAKAQEALAGTLWRHHARLDNHGVARAAVEFLAVQFSEKIGTPAIWYLVAGLPGLFFCLLVTLMHETFAVSGSEFGKAAKSTYTLMQWVPSRLTACMWMLAALFQAEGDFKKTAQTIWSYMATKSPQALTVASCATVMQVSLGGPPSVYSDKNWLGAGTVKLGAAHVKKAQYFFAVLHFLLVVVLGLIM